MKKKLYSVFTALLMAALMVSEAVAGGFSIRTSLGSFLADVTAWGLPNSTKTGYTFTVNASGVASVICTNPGNNPVPGQSSPHVDGTDSQDIPPGQITKGGKVTTSLEAIPDLEAHPDLTAEAGGCPNSNWSAKVDFIYWQAAVFTVKNNTTGEETTYKYNCVTTRTGPAGDPNSTFDDGTVSCTPQ